MKNHEFGEGDNFLDGLCLGYDDGDIRGEWATRPQVIIPKLGEVALLLGLSVQDANVDENPPQS